MSQAPGLSPTQLRRITDSVRASLMPGQTARLWVWGSRARGDHRAYSDADIAVEAVPPWTSAQKSATAEALEESNLPFKVDLVAESEIAAAYRPSYLAERREIGS